MRKFIMALLVLICFILQTSAFKSIALAGVVPNILIILVSSFGFMRGESAGLVIGFFAGLLCDIFFGDFIGLYAIIYMYIGYVNGMFSRMFYKEDIKLPLALIFISDLTYGLSSFLTQFLLRGRFNFVFYLYKVIIPEILYTILATIVFYPIFLLINMGLETREKRR